MHIIFKNYHIIFNPLYIIFKVFSIFPQCCYIIIYHMYIVFDRLK